MYEVNLNIINNLCVNNSCTPTLVSDLPVVRHHISCPQDLDYSPFWLPSGVSDPSIAKFPAKKHHFTFYLSTTEHI